MWDRLLKGLTSYYWTVIILLYLSLLRRRYRKKYGVGNVIAIDERLRLMRNFGGDASLVDSLSATARLALLQRLPQQSTDSERGRTMR